MEQYENSAENCHCNSSSRHKKKSGPAFFRKFFAENKIRKSHRSKNTQFVNGNNNAYNAVLDGMIRVNHGENGTASDYFIDFDYTVAGKTGTAEDDPTGSDNGAYICFAPVEDPQIAIAIYVEKGGHGNTMSMIAREVIAEYLNVEEVSDVPTFENRLS